MKEYTIIKTRRGRKTEVKGTLEYLLSYFGYTLECGKCYEHEKGNHKINMKPTTGKALVSALNYAASNSAANGCPDSFYTLA